MANSLVVFMLLTTLTYSRNVGFATRDDGDTTARALPHYLPDALGRPPSAWLTVDAGSDDVPDTGVTRTYDMTVSRATARPDGVDKPSILLNGGNMGPLIEANWGDWVEVRVRNNMTTPKQDGFTLHWHGLLQKRTPWSDGVPGVSQCPIAPGKSLTYLFRADQIGSSWYHSHFTAQYTDGAFGPMVFYGPTQPGVGYDEDLGIFLFHDYSHKTYEESRDDSFRKPPQFNDLDNNLLNGRGCNVSAGACDWTTTRLQTHRVSAGKSYRLRLVNAGGAGTQKISVDGHSLIVVANDYVPVVPYQTMTVTLGIGQRTDVILRPGVDRTTTISSSSAAVYLRGFIDLPCTNGSARHDEARALILLDSPRNATPSSTPTPWTNHDCQNDALALSVPAYPRRPPSRPATTQELVVDAVFNSTGSYVFVVNNHTFHADYNQPLLLAAEHLNHPGDDVIAYDFGSNSSVRLVVYNYAPFAHPMHLHGHNFWALANGFGRWDGHTIVNGDNPSRRDTVLMPPARPDAPSFLVLEWIQDNPGVWPMHCHIALHNGHGLFVNFVERPGDMVKQSPLPRSVVETCHDWQAWTSTHLVDEVDAGI